MKQILAKNSVLLMLVAFLASVIVVFPTSTEAQARCIDVPGVPCIDVGNGAGTGSGTGGGRDPGTGGGGSGGGIITTPPPPPPEITRPIYESYTVDFRDRVTTNPLVEQAASRYCTQSERVIGAKVRVTYMYNESNAAIVTGTWRVLTPSTCITLNSWDETLKCYTKADVEIAKVAGGNLRTLDSGTVGTSWNGNGATGTYNQCINSNRVVVSLGSPITEYGRYTADATVYYTTIQVRHFERDPITGAAAYVKTIGFNNTVRSNTNYNYGQLTCYGFNINSNRNLAWTGSGWSWTETDCGPASGSPTPTYQCVNPNATIDGIAYNPATPFEIFRDNLPHSIDWGSPTLQMTSGAAVTVNGTETGFLHSGTPVIDNITLSQGNKEIRLDPNRASSWISGINATADLQARWSTDRNSALVIQPVYRYTIQWVDTGVEIVSINPFTNEVVYGSYSTLRNSTAECAGLGVNFNVLRTVNASG